MINLLIDNKLLIKEKWEKEDLKLFHIFEKSLKDENLETCEWEKKITCTKLECFGKTSEKAKIIAREIKKGNYTSFLDNLEIESFFDSILSAYLISQIKDFSTFQKQLNRFVATVDCWASCDALTFSNHNKEQLFLLAKKYLKNKNTFIRRVGIRIYFELIKDENYLYECFNVINSLKNEKEYYVNMCAAWLLCECLIKYRKKTLDFFKNNNTNAFIINKAISKCRDSFRVCKDDKTLLLKFKKQGDILQ